MSRISRTSSLGSLKIRLTAPTTERNEDESQSFTKAVSRSFEKKFIVDKRIIINPQLNKLVLKMPKRLGLGTDTDTPSFRLVPNQFSEVQPQVHEIKQEVKTSNYKFLNGIFAFKAKKKEKKSPHDQINKQLKPKFTLDTTSTGGRPSGILNQIVPTDVLNNPTLGVKAKSESPVQPRQSLLDSQGNQLFMTTSDFRPGDAGEEHLRKGSMDRTPNKVSKDLNNFLNKEDNHGKKLNFRQLSLFRPVPGESSPFAQIGGSRKDSKNRDCMSPSALKRNGKYSTSSAKSLTKTMGDLEAGLASKKVQFAKNILIYKYSIAPTGSNGKSDSPKE